MCLTHRWTMLHHGVLNPRVRRVGLPQTHRQGRAVDNVQHRHGGIIALFIFTRSFSADRPPGEGVQSMGHKWDGDLEELNNPLPRWWLNMFYITMVWAVVYLLLYPGVGTHPMLLGWSQVQQYDEEMAARNHRDIFVHELLEDDKPDSRDAPSKSG